MKERDNEREQWLGIHLNNKRDRLKEGKHVEKKVEI